MALEMPRVYAAAVPQAALGRLVAGRPDDFITHGAGNRRHAAIRALRAPRERTRRNSLLGLPAEPGQTSFKLQRDRPVGPQGRPAPGIRRARAAHESAAHFEDYAGNHTGSGVLPVR